LIFMTFVAPRRGRRRAIRPGLDRPGTPYAWPPSLLAQPGGKPLVYLDRNHWSDLSDAANGRPHATSLEAALEALRHAEHVAFPLASVQYVEMEGEIQRRRRRDMSALMEELSDFVCLPPRSNIVTVEVDAALAQLIDTSMGYTRALRLGRGVMQACGRNGGLRVYSPDGGDVTDRARAEWLAGPAAFDAFSRHADRQLTRSVLVGPQDEETELDLRARGWDPTVGKRIAEDRAATERELQVMLSAEPEYRARLRDVVSARYLGREVLDRLCDELVERGLAAQVSEILGDIEVARWLTDAMPAGDAWISLLTAAHRNPQRRWKPNHMFDFDALTVAIPYCDIVVTDREACALAHESGLPDRLGTRVLASLDELVVAVDELL